MFPTFTIFVLGLPTGQPRIKAASRGKFVTIYTPKKVKNATTGKYHTHPAEVWGQAIAEAWKAEAPAMPKISVPVCLTLCFHMPRPKSHFNSKGDLKATAPSWYEKKPDADNLAKCVMDRMSTLGVWDDDDQVVILKVSKNYTADYPAGCHITLRDAAEFGGVL